MQRGWGLGGSLQNVHAAAAAAASRQKNSKHGSPAHAGRPQAEASSPQVAHDPDRAQGPPGLNTPSEVSLSKQTSTDSRGITVDPHTILSYDMQRCYVSLSARAVTYADVMSLNTHALLHLLARDTEEKRKEEVQKRTEKTKQLYRKLRSGVRMMNGLGDSLESSKTQHRGAAPTIRGLFHSIRDRKTNTSVHDVKASASERRARGGGQTPKSPARGAFDHGSVDGAAVGSLGACKWIGRLENKAKNRACRRSPQRRPPRRLNKAPSGSSSPAVSRPPSAAPLASPDPMPMVEPSVSV